VNNKTTYEILIAEKAGQVPVPDMADAIWASIEAQLDANPGDDGDINQAPTEQPPLNKIMSGTKMWLVIISIVAIVILLLLLTKNSRNNTHQKKIPALQEQEDQPQKNIIVDTVTNLPTGREKLPAGQFQPVNSALDVVVPPVFISPVGNDSISKEPFKKPGNDSVALPTLVPQVIQRDSITTLPPPSKKNRGVKGIEDSDYRVSGGKKDSHKR
jgi:hypothetical protein